MNHVRTGVVMALTGSVFEMLVVIIFPICVLPNQSIYYLCE